jgi:hypothetical protein
MDHPVVELAVAQLVEQDPERRHEAEQAERELDFRIHTAVADDGSPHARNGGHKRQQLEADVRERLESLAGLLIVEL